MKMNCKELSKVLEQKLEDLDPHITLRVRKVMEDFVLNDLGRFEKMDVFDIFLRFLLRADQDPASLIANLMVPLHNDDVTELEEWTISSSAAFIRDQLKKDYMIQVLESEKKVSRK